MAVTTRLVGAVGGVRSRVWAESSDEPHAIVINNTGNILVNGGGVRVMGILIVKAAPHSKRHAERNARSEQLPCPRNPRDFVAERADALSARRTPLREP
jgi:hypothetical protein